jgi:hypothetical protein
MRGFMSYILAGIVVVATMDAIAPPAGLGLAIAKWPAVDRNTAVQVIDRSHKGDRLHVPMATSRPTSPLSAPVLLIGCEPVFSSLSASSRANFAGRCMA